MKPDKTDNELIAEFMYGSDCHTAMLGQAAVLVKTGPTTGVVKFLADCKFDTSWDWLMPVIKKIGGMWSPDYSQRSMLIHHLLDLQLDVDIDVAYNEVVEFIKWHNSL